MILALAGRSALAATKTWDNGGSDNLWGTAANWNPDGVPGSSDDVVFNGTSTANCYYDKVSETIASITFSSAYTGKFQWGYAQFGKGLRGQYFADDAYTGGTFSRVDATVNFASDWGEPASGIGTDTYRVVWTGFILPQYAETYTFYETSDDGGKLTIDGNLIIDQFGGSGMTMNQATMGYSFSASTLYKIRYEYYEGTGTSGAILEWSSTSQGRQVIPQNRMFPDHNGLKTQWWSNTDMTGTTGTNAAPFVDYNWGAVGPDDFFTNDDFSGEIQGYIIPQYTETYTFHSYKDDGLRIYVNDVLIMDSWNCGCGNNSSSTIDLVAGVPYYIEMEFRDTGGNGYVNLQWSSASQSQQVVPVDRLYVPYWLNVSGTVDLRSGGEFNMDAGELQFIGSGAQTFYPHSSETLSRVIQNGSGTTTVSTNNLTALYLEVRSGTLNLGTGRTVNAGYLKIQGGTVNFNTSTLNLAQKDISFSAVGSATSGAAGSALVVTSSTAYTTTLSGTLTGTDLDVTFNGNGASTVSGNLSIGAGTLTKNGTNTLTLSGNNGGQSGPITVSAGTLQVNATSDSYYNQTPFTNNATVNFNPTANAVIDLRSQLRGTGTWNFDGPGGGNILQNRVLFRGNVTASDATGAVNLINSAKLWLEATNGYYHLGPTQVVDIAASAVLAPIGTGTRTIGGLTGSGTVNNWYNLGSPTLEIANASNYTFSGIIKNDVTTLYVVKSGTGAQTLSGANTFSGGLTLNGGDLIVSHNTALGSGTAVLGANAARFMLTNGVTVANALTINSCEPGSGMGCVQGPGGTDAATWSGAITVNATPASGGTFQGGNNTNGLTLSGTVTSASNTIIMRNYKTTFSGGGSYSELKCAQGSCVVGATNGISTSALLYIATSGTTTVELGGFSQTCIGLKKGGGTATVTSSSGTPTLTLNMSTTETFDGAITGSLALTKTGSGTQNIGGTNTWSGATNVTGGTLAVTGGSCVGMISLILSGGGNMTIAGTVTLASDANSIFGVGYGATGTSTLTLTSGALTAGQSGGRAFVGGGPNGGTYGTGVLTISGGTCTIGVNGAFPNDNLYLAGYGGDGTLNLDGGILALQRKVARGAGPSTFNLNGGTFKALAAGVDIFSSTINTVNVRNGGAIFDNNGFDITINHALPHSALGGDNATDGGLTVLGSAVTTLVAGSTYTGTTTISAGTLKLGAAGAIPDNSAVTATGTLDLASRNETIGSLAGGGFVENSTGAGTYTLTTGGNNTGTVFTGILKNTAGTVALVKAGTGQLQLQGNNTYTGGTTINGGEIFASHNNSFGTGSVTINASSFVRIWASSAITMPNNWVLNGSSGDANAPTLCHDGGAGLVTLNGTINVTAASEIGICGSTSNNMQLNGVISGSGNITVDEANGGSVQTLIFNATNTFSGTLTVLPGVLRLAAANSIPDGVAVTNNATTGGIDLYGHSETVGSIAGTGIWDSNNGAGTFTLTTGGDNTSTSYSGVIKNTAGTVTVTKAGTGTWTVSGNSTYIGATLVSGGVLKLGHATAAMGTNAGGLTVNSGAALDLNGMTYSTAEAAVISGTGVSSGGAIFNSSSTAATYAGQLTLAAASSVIAGTGNITLSATGTIAGAGYNLTLGGAANGSLASIVGTTTGKILKQDAGTWTLSGTSTYTGGTEISGGVLSTSAAANLGSPSGTKVVDFTGHGTLAVTSSWSTTKELEANGSARSITVDVASGQTFTNTGHLRAHQGTLPPVYKTNTGTWIQGGDGSYVDGEIFLNAGTMEFQVANGFGDGGGDTLIMAANTTLRLVNDAATTFVGGVSVRGAGTSIVVNRATGGAGVTHSINFLNTDGAYTIPLTSGANITSGTAGLTVRNATTLGGNTVLDVTDPGTPDILLTLTGAVGGATYGLTVQGTGNTTINGVIGTTSGTLTKAGAGTLTLGGNNTFTGATAINAGTVKTGHANALGTTATGTTVASGATLDLNATAVGAEPLSLTGSGVGALGAMINSGAAASFSGAVTLANPVYVGGSGDITLSGAVTTATLIKIGSHQLTLSGAADNANMSLTANAGTVVLAKTSSGSVFAVGGLGVTLGGGTVKLGGTGGQQIYDGSGVTLNTGIFDMNALSETIKSLEGSGGTLDNTSGAGTYTLTMIGTSTYSNAATIQNTSGTVALTINGSGAVHTWTGANTYSGATTISAGTLKLGSATALGAVGGITTVASGAVLDLNGITYTNAEPLTISGTGISSGGAVINGSATPATFPGLLTLGAAASVIAGTGNITLSHVGTITGAGLGLTLGGAQSGSLASILGTTTGTLTKQNAGTWTLSGANTYTGGSSISAGTLSIAAENNLGAPSADQLLIYTGDAMLAVTGTFSTNKELYCTGASRSVGVDVAGGQTFTTSGNLGGFGALRSVGSNATIKQGAGTWVLGSPNGQNDDDISLLAGTLDIRDAGALGNAANLDAVHAAAGTTIRFTADTVLTVTGYIQTEGTGVNIVSDRLTAGAGVAHSVYYLNTNGAHTVNLSAGANVTSGTQGLTVRAGGTLVGHSVVDVADPGTPDMLLTWTTSVNGAAKNLTVQGTGNTLISGVIGTTTGTLTKAGTGTLTLSATNTFTGTTTVNAGSLSLTGSTHASSAVTVNSGGTLEGTGSVLGTLTVANGGIVSPGVANETTINAGATVMNSTSVLSYTLGTVNTDKLAVTGNFTLDGTLNITAGTGFTYGTYVIATYTGSLTNNTLATGTMPTGFYGTITASGGVVSINILDYTGFNYVSTIQFNTTSAGANVPNNVTNFPMLVRLDSNNFYFEQATIDGRDIRFSDPDGTALQYEIERWDATARRAEIWVLVPQVDGNSDRDFMYMYWGNASATAQTSANRVFQTSNGFASVWHLGEDGNNTASGYADATGNGNNGTGSSMSAASDVSGVIGKAQEFDGTADYISVGTGASMRPASYITLSAWVNTRTGASAESYFTNHQDNACTESGFYPGWSANLNKYYFALRTASMACSNWYDNAPWMGGGINVWSYVTATYDGAKIRTYQNGIPTDSLAATGAIQWGTLPTDARIGMYYDSDESRYHDGFVDELTLASVARSADWIRLSYETQKPNTQALTYPNTRLSTWAYSSKVYVNTSATGANTQTDVSNFPMLVRLNASNFNFAQARGDGADLRFADSTGALLAYELARYDAANKEAEAWVLLPTVKANNNAQWFRMYWGKSNTASLSSATAVFHPTNGIIGEYHMSESSGTLTDATGNGNAGTFNGNLPNLQTGLIGKAHLLDGNGDYVSAASNATMDLSANDRLTVSAWVNRSGNAVSGTDEGIVSKLKWSGSNDRSWQLIHKTGGNGYRFGVSSDGTSGNEAFATSSITATNGSWTHVAGVADGTKIRVYVNGIEAANTAWTGNIYHTNVPPFKIGMNDDDGGTNKQFFNGYIDEVTVQNQARSSDWIRLAYQSQKAATTTVLVGTRPADFSASARFNFNTTASGANVSGDVANIPILVKLTSANLNFASTRDDAADLQFVDKDGSYLYHEIVEWDKANGVGKVWVKVPQVDGNSTADFITLYYGCAACAASTYAVKDSVWSGFKSVFHLDGDDDQATDAATLANHGTPYQNQAQVSGITTKTATRFDGTSDYITIPDESDYDIANNISVWAWFNVNAFTKNFQTLVAKGDGNFVMHRDNNNNGIAFACYEGGVGWENAWGDVNVTGGGWHLAVGTYDGTNIKMYIDGALDDSRGVSGNCTANNYALTIGENGQTTGRQWNGAISEVRIGTATAVPSADFIKLSFENQKAASTLFSATTFTASTTSFQKSKVFAFNTTASGANVPGDVYNFPLLLRITGSVGGTPITDLAQSTGADIRFLDGDGVTWLDYQIERWSQSLDSAEVWVKVPRIRGNSNNGFITMYYQQASGVTVPDGQCATCVFGAANGFAATYHLATDVTDAGGAYNGTDNATGDVGGIIGRGRSFNGTTGYISLTRPVQDDFTIGFWMNTTTAGNNGGAQWYHHTPLVDGEVAGDVTDFGVCYGTKYATFGTGNTDNTIATSGADSVQSGAWKYVTAVRKRNGATKYLYLDGAQKNTSATTQASLTSPTSLNIGRMAAAGRFYTGNIDEVQISSVARDTSWILLTYQTQRRDAAPLFNPSATDFQKTKKFVFNTTKTGANIMDSVTNFPMLVRVTGTAGGTAITDLVQGSGTSAPPDIRFLDGDGKTWLNYVVERWDRAVDSAEVWVMVPKVDGNSDHDYITMYYQQASGSAPADGQCGSCVFGTATGYSGVWHMDDNVASTAVVEAVAGAGSTLYNDNTTDNSNGHSSAGVIGRSLNFMGGAAGVGGGVQKENFRHNVAWPKTSGTVSMWAKPDQSRSMVLLYESNGTTSDHNGFTDNANLLEAHLQLSGATWGVTYQDGANLYVNPTGGTGTVGAWAHVAATWTRTDSMYVFVDGVRVAAQYMGNKAFSSTTPTVMQFGRVGDAADTRHWDGMADEIQIQSAQRSPYWIKLAYETQRRDGSFWNNRAGPNNQATLTATAGSRNIALAWSSTVSDSSNADSVRIWVKYNGYADTANQTGVTRVVTLPKTDSAYNYPAVASGTYYFSLAVRNTAGLWSPITQAASDTANLTGYSFYPDTVYVDSAIGNDANSCAQAASPLTPKLSVAGASGAQACDPNASDSLFIRVMPGTYAGADNWNFQHTTKPVIVSAFDRNSRPVFNSSVGSGVWNSTEWLPTVYLQGDVYLRFVDVKAGQADGTGIMTAQAPQNPNAIEGCRIFNNGSTKNARGILLTNNTHDYQHVANNLIYQPTTIGIHLRVNSRFNVVNNVVIGEGTGGTTGIMNNTAAGSATSNIANNIVYNWDTGISTTSSTAAIGTVSNNLFHLITSGQEVVGCTDANKVVKDPLFANTTPGNPHAFKLLPGSPALDAGTSTFTSGFSRTTPADYFGSSRPQGSAIDIGFYEGTGYTSTPASEFDSLITTSTSTTVTVKNSKWKLTWDMARGAGINFFSDMADSATNLLSASSLLFDAKVGSYQASSQTTGGVQLGFVERTRARAVVRQWLNVSASLNLIITYAVYPSGHIYISSELENLGSSTATLGSFDYTLKLGTTTSAATGSGGAKNGFGYLNTATRDALLSVTQDLDQGAATAETWTLTPTAGPPGTIVFATANPSNSAKWLKRAHAFLLYIGDQALDRQKAATLNADAYAPSVVTATSGSLLMERSWQDGLAGHWTLDDGGGGKARDKAVNNQNDASITAADTIWTSGKVGGGLYLNNTDVAVVPDNDNLEACFSCTYMFWVKPDFAGMGTTAFLISKGITTSDGWYFRKVSAQNQITFNMGAASATTQTLTDGAWTHIAAVVKLGGTKIDLYVNGVMVANSTVAATATANATALRFGENTAGGAADRFKGTLDDIRIYRNEIYNQDIQAIFNRGFSPKYGHYALRSDNNNRVVALLNGGAAATRVQPAFQITNWYGIKTPKYVYLNGTRLKPVTDFIVDSLNTVYWGSYLVLQLNKTLTGADQTLFIDDDDSTGYMGTSSAMKALTITATANDKIVIKNFADTVFGNAASGQWYTELDLNGWTTNTQERVVDSGFGEFSVWKAAAINPNVAVSSATQLVGQDNDQGRSLASMRFEANGAGVDMASAGNGYLSPANIGYNVTDSSAVRLSLTLTPMSLSSTDGTATITKRWTVYPTGRIFGSFVVASQTFNFDSPSVEFNARGNSGVVNAWSAATADAGARWGWMGGDLDFHSGAAAVLSVKNATSAYTTAGALMGSSSNLLNANGGDYYKARLALQAAKFTSGNAPVTINFVVDISRDFTDSATADSLMRDLQTPALITAITGSRITNDALDFNADNFAEGDGAYTASATSGVAHFKFANTVTCFNPAFRISSWTYGTLPEVVILDNQTLTKGYHYNAYLNAGANELVLQFNKTLSPASHIFFISHKTGLAVTLNKFEAKDGDGVDTLHWTTESEFENLGYHVWRRVAPAEMQIDTAFAAAGEAEIAGAGIANALRTAARNEAAKRAAAKVAQAAVDTGLDTIPSLNLMPEELRALGYERITPRLIPGAKGGSSASTQNYTWIDRSATIGIAYEYLLEALDFNGSKVQYGPRLARPQNPMETELGSNYPNPFNPVTTLRFSLKEKLKVSLVIYDAKGKLVRTLIRPDKPMGAGKYRLTWDAKNESGLEVPSGQYFYRFTAGRYVKTRKMILVK